MRNEFFKYVLNEIKNRGGHLISTYENSRAKLHLKCHNNHDFYMCWNKIQQGQWCPLCSKSISERICRLFFEKIFQTEFPTVKPNWLIGYKHYPLELDGYSKKLGIAFEHNGSQHYYRKFNQSKESFNQLLKNDSLKKDMCKNNDVKLIIIPELFKKTKINRLKEVIKEECKKLKIDIPNNFDLINIDINEIYKTNHIKTKYTFNDIISVATSKNGFCLSNEYNPYKMKFKCRNNHIWETSPTSIMKYNSWCLKCHLNNKISKNNILTKELLAVELDKLNLTEIAKKYNVSRITVRKYCKQYNLK